MKPTWICSSAVETCCIVEVVDVLEVEEDLVVFCCWELLFTWRKDPKVSERLISSSTHLPSPHHVATSRPTSKGHARLHGRLHEVATHSDARSLKTRSSNLSQLMHPQKSKQHLQVRGRSPPLFPVAFWKVFAFRASPASSDSTAHVKVARAERES